MAGTTVGVVEGSGNFSVATQNQDGSQHKDRKATNILTKNASEMVSTLAKNTEGLTPLLQANAKHSAKIAVNTASIVTAVNAINRTLQSLLSSTQQYQKMQTQMGQEAQKMRQLQHQQAMFDQQMAAVAERQNRGAAAAPIASAPAAGAPSHGGGGSGGKGAAGGGLLGAGLGMGLGALLGQGVGGMVGGGIGGALFGPMGAVLGATLGKPLAEIGKKIDTRLGKPIAGLWNTVKTFTSKLWNWMPKSWDQLKTTVTGLGTSLKEWLGKAWKETVQPALGKVFTHIWDFKVNVPIIGQKSIGELLGIVAGVYIGKSIGGIFGPIGSLVGAALGGVAGGMLAKGSENKRAAAAMTEGSDGANAHLVDKFKDPAFQAWAKENKERQAALARGRSRALAGHGTGQMDQLYKQYEAERGDAPPDNDGIFAHRANSVLDERLDAKQAKFFRNWLSYNNYNEQQMYGWGTGGSLKKAFEQYKTSEDGQRKYFSNIYAAKKRDAAPKYSATADILSGKGVGLEMLGQDTYNAVAADADGAGLTDGGFGEGDTGAQVWRGFRTFTPDGKKAYLKNGKYEAVDDWDPNDGTKSGGGWMSKLFGGISDFFGNVAGGIGDMFGAKGEVRGGGTIDWRGKDSGLKPGLIKRINLLAQQSGERLVVTDGLRTQQQILNMKESYDRQYGKPSETPYSWRWKIPGKQDQVLNKPGTGYDTHSYGRAVDISIPGKPWGSSELRNVNRLAKAMGLHGYKDTETKGHFNLPMDGSLDKGDAPPPVPTPAPMPALATASDVASASGSRSGGNVVVGGSPTTIVNAPQTSGGGGENLYLTELWSLANGMDGALAGGFA